MNTRQFYDWLKKPRSTLTLIDAVQTELHGPENLSSYLLRVQNLMGVKVKDVIYHAGTAVSSQHEEFLWHHLVRSDNLPIKLLVPGKSTAALCEVLQLIKPKFDFKDLTLAYYTNNKSRLSGVPKLKTEINWCSHCIRDWDINEMHFPTSWQVQGIYSCAKHSIPFSNRCPHCGMAFSSFSKSLLAGRCCRCKEPLTRWVQPRYLQQELPLDGM